MLMGKKAYSLSQNYHLPIFLNKILNGMGMIHKPFCQKHKFWDEVIQSLPDIVIYNLDDLSKKSLDELKKMKKILKNVGIPILVVCDEENSLLKRYFKKIDINYSLDQELAQNKLYLQLNKIFFDNKAKMQNFKIEFTNEKIKARMRSTLSKVGELSCRIKSPVKIVSYDDSFYLESKTLHNAGIVFSKLKKQTDSSFKKDKVFETDFILTGLSRKSADLIRTETYKWGSK